jgi:hypothetical protein
MFKININPVGFFYGKADIQFMISSPSVLFFSIYNSASFDSESMSA